MKPKIGEMYLANREDTFHQKKKFQIYFDDNCVLLVNSKASRNSISPVITPKDCSLLSHDSYICLDSVFTYDKRQKVIKVEQISREALERLKEMLPYTNRITEITINRIIKYIENILNKPVNNEYED